ncbi:restriction endonuclease subunit M [Prolixibacter denitrificans]|uniref:site-specific DNA-methyltransferase (adenine-specific) n=1 Tax=Prolixibacter denitrificans TaxID=1541063 RepID=A0ABQ0ZHB8_9BACT|nr:restriction endonuclease subunit M [Prolixibacter denitrificans]
MPVITDALPKDLEKKPFVYVEPFVGSGAVLFRMLDKFPNIEKAVINDVNEDLINAYRTIQEEPDALIESLQQLEREYNGSPEEEFRQAHYLMVRELFNKREKSRTEHTAYLIFLNRTCYNGLYRVNKENQFNVPFGKHKNPKICNEANIRLVHKVLQKVEIRLGDFDALNDLVTPDAFFYFDPPYKPISSTASFNAYSQNGFGDGDQERLKGFCDKLHETGARLLLSNSDPKNEDPENHFFDELYGDYQIERVQARRAINSRGSRRGEISELLIRNYD